MPQTRKWSDIKRQGFFQRFGHRMLARGRRIRSRLALGLFIRIWPMILGPDRLRTPYGRLLERILPHRNPDERNPIETLDRIIRERDTQIRSLQAQAERILTQADVIQTFTGLGISRLEAEVRQTTARIEALTRPTSWEQLDKDDL